MTPKLESTTVIPRLQNVSSDELVKLAHIVTNILLPSHRPKMAFKELPSLPLLDISSIDYEWTSTWFLNPLQPLWSVFMQMVQDGYHHGTVSNIFMPMIERKNTDPICILSTMNFVCTLAHKHSMTTVLIFDQTTRESNGASRYPR